MNIGNLHKIIVCGAGTMGSGIAETAASNGYTTLLYDPVASALQNAERNIQQNLAMLVEKEKIAADKKSATIRNLSFSTDINDCRGDLVIEAIFEDLPAKQQLFSSINDLNSNQTLLASNTSSLSVSSIAETIAHRERIFGLHFFNPAPVMKLVEVVTTSWTSKETVDTVIAFVKALGKVPVLCSDSPGFIVNRVARHYYLEALKLLEDGVANIETIDRVLENAGFRMGPFRLMDLIGNDVNLAVTRSMYDAFGQIERFRPSAIQENKVSVGDLGRKAGKGFYIY
jgi:3-hydroxybutyryl-CoA dehydrogenase